MESYSKLIATTTVIALSQVLFANSVERISIPATGGQFSGMSSGGRVSADGRFTVFVTSTPGQGQTLNVRDSVTATTFPVPLPNGTFIYTGNLGGLHEEPSISDDGRYVVFASNSPISPLYPSNRLKVYIYDRSLNVFRVIDPANGSGSPKAYFPIISGDGRTVVFLGQGIIPGGPNSDQLYSLDLTTGVYSMVSRSDGGTPANFPITDYDISKDGSIVAFASVSSNLVQNDVNGTIGDIFIRDQNLQTTTLVSRATDGSQGNGQSWECGLSSTGRYIGFISGSTNFGPSTLVAVYLRDLLTGQTIRASSPLGGSFGGISVSSTGQYVAYTLTSNNPPITQGFYVRDTLNDKFSFNFNSNLFPRISHISADGRYVNLVTQESNLDPNDTNSENDVYRFDLANRLISGTVNLEDYVPNVEGKEISWSLRTSPTGSTIEVGKALLSAAGAYQIRVDTTSGMGYVLVINVPKWLNGGVENIDLNSNVSGVDFTLVNGDVTVDNEVGPSDFEQLVSAFGASAGDPNWNPNADLDGDGEVGPVDFEIIVNNFGLQGY